MRAPLVRRIRRKMWGGLIDVRFYADGSSRVRADHPSNDPAVELAMGGVALSLLREAYAKTGIDAKLGPIHWNDDPPVSS